METKQNKMFISRRKAIASLLATGVGLTASFATTPASFAATLSAFANPTPRKLKAKIKTAQAALKKQKLGGKRLKAALKTYTPKTNKIAAPLSAKDLTATFTEYPLKSTDGPLAAGITTGDTGSDFWFAESEANRIGKITTQGAITEYLLPLSGYNPDAIANGPGDTFWFTYTKYGSTAYIGRIVGASGQVTLYALPSDITYATDIVRGPNDTLWFTTNNGKVGSMTADGAITLYTPSNVKDAPSIAAGPDGALWFSVVSPTGSSSIGGIGRITTSGDYTFYPLSIGFADRIATGRNNDLWFTAGDAGVVGRITTSGQVTLYSVPGLNRAYPYAIAHLGNGTFSFGTNPGGSRPGTYTNYVGTITPAGDIQLFEAPKNIGPNQMVYAGWANEVWYTAASEIVKFRVTS